ncbi:hypothetical protein M9H77_01818 [Catharanthus roseus]|uniref:Uncharacterized protein n=1 Tax=Catharanthus roseus TaxID=4058 RepID=A0ACC0C720_CATRO|nr:hypothetical protein M9H77_01818 [Catharanthus roseus]
MAMSENWQLFVHGGRHNYAIGVYHHDHTQAARLMDEQLIQAEQFRKSHMPPRNIAHTIYNVLAKMKKKRMQGHYTVQYAIVGGHRYDFDRIAFWGRDARSRRRWSEIVSLLKSPQEQVLSTTGSLIRRQEAKWEVYDIRFFRQV